MTATEAIRALLNRATRAERPVVESLALAAGLRWRCGVSRYCTAINEREVTVCSSCRTPRKLP